MQSKVHHFGGILEGSCLEPQDISPPSKKTKPTAPRGNCSGKLCCGNWQGAEAACDSSPSTLPPRGAWKGEKVLLLLPSRHQTAPNRPASAFPLLQKPGEEEIKLQQGNDIPSLGQETTRQSFWADTHWCCLLVLQGILPQPL